jgi:hypothetical protein
MNVTAGALSLPAPHPTEALMAEGFAGDPALALLALFLGHTLNHYLGDLYRALRPQDSKPVTLVAGHDPKRWSFSTADLPALYVWRQGDAATEFEASETLLTRSNVVALWALPECDSETARRVAGMNGAVSRAVVAALRAGQVPGLVLETDTDPQAPTYGSNALYLAGFRSVQHSRTDYADLTIPAGGSTIRCPAVLVGLQTAELVTIDPEGDSAEALDVTVREEAGWQAVLSER